MKPHRVWAATGCLLAALTGGTASAQSANFTLVNNTGYTIYSVHFWPSGRGYRGSDRLGDDVIGSGQSRTFAPYDGGCIYDIRVRLEDNGYEKQWNNVNLCNLYRFTLNYNYQTRILWASSD